MHRFNRKEAISLGHIGVKHQCIGGNDHLHVKWSVLSLTFVFTHSLTYAPLYFRRKYSNVLHILIHVFSFYLWTAVVLFDQCEQKDLPPTNLDWNWYCEALWLCVVSKQLYLTMGMFAWRNSGGIWMVWRNAGGICERKTRFRMKKEADQAEFKGTRMGPIYGKICWFVKDK